MRVHHKVSFPGAQNYEQYAAEFEITTEDIPPEQLNGCNLLEKMFVFDTLVAYQGILFQYLKGYIDKNLLNDQSKRLFGMLTPKLEQIVKNILKVDGVSQEKESGQSGKSGKPVEKPKQKTTKT